MADQKDIGRLQRVVGTVLDRDVALLVGLNSQVADCHARRAALDREVAEAATEGSSVTDHMALERLRLWRDQERRVVAAQEAALQEKIAALRKVLTRSFGQKRALEGLQIDLRQAAVLKERRRAERDGRAPDR